MKKIYMSPSMDVIELKNQQVLLAGSEIGLGDPGNANDAESPEFGADDLTFDDFTIFE